MSAASWLMMSHCPALVLSGAKRGEISTSVWAGWAGWLCSADGKNGLGDVTEARPPARRIT